MIDEIIAEMGKLFRKGVFAKRTTFRFVVGDDTITIGVDAESFSAEKGDLGGKVDCTCQTSAEMFNKIWFQGYKPGMMDFLGGAIKADAPMLLPQFVKAFEKIRS